MSYQAQSDTEAARSLMGVGSHNPHNPDDHRVEEHEHRGFVSRFYATASKRRYLSVAVFAALIVIFGIILTTTSEKSHTQTSHKADAARAARSSSSSNRNRASGSPTFTNLTEKNGSHHDPIQIPSSADDKGQHSALVQQTCEPPYPGYPYCEAKVNELLATWKHNEDWYRSQGVDGTKCSALTFLNLNGFYCPEAADYAKEKIRGVNLGGWLVLEPWITPSVFEPYRNISDYVQDQYTLCEHLGKTKCRALLEKHWDTFLVEDDIRELAEGGINHVRIPVGYWIMGDIRAGEPWVLGDLKYLARGIGWCAKYGIHVVLDLHCAPGSQNGFDNSGRKGEIHFHASEKLPNGRVIYPNIIRTLQVIDALTAYFSQPQFVGTVVAVELVNEIFITVPIEIVKDFYLQGYEIVKKYGDLAVIIGDSFRFGEWGNFMFPPHYRHVWIDTHIYQVFDMYRLSMSWEQHLDQTCKVHMPEVAVAPLSTLVGEWSLATTDCTTWLNGFGSGARYDGTFPGSYYLGSCEHDLDVSKFTPEYRNFLREYAEKQMDAYESGSSAGWFFWNFKAEKSPQWNYLLGLREGWIPKDHKNRKHKC